MTVRTTGLRVALVAALAIDCGSRAGLEGPVAAEATGDAAVPRDGTVPVTDGGAPDARPATPPAPRPIAPLSTATVSSQRPTLRWVLPPGSDGARVVLCRDRACRQTEQVLEARGTQVRPDRALAPGPHFWRLEGGPAGGRSPTWEFFVGHRDAPRDASWGTTLDVNGDGYADLAVGAPGAERVHLYLGGPAGLAANPSRSLQGPGSVEPDGGQVLVRFGDVLASAGDMNGDGFADLVVSDSSGPGSAERVHVYLGGGEGPPSRPSLTLTNPFGAHGHFGFTLASIGDANGDGYADLAVGAPGAPQEASHVYAYLGGPSGPARMPATILAQAAEERGSYGVVASVGDVNGDGFADLAIGHPSADASSGRVYIHLGEPGGISRTPAVTLSGPDGARSVFGYALAGDGDLNGDGRPDLVVGAPDARQGDGCAYVFVNSPSGLAAGPPVVLRGAEDARSGLGGRVRVIGDFDGNGYAELLLGAARPKRPGGQAFLYMATDQGVPQRPAAALTEPDAGSSLLARTLSAIGDANGDALSDIAIGSYVADQNAGRVDVYYGSRSGFMGAPGRTLRGPDGPDSFFGHGMATRGWLSPHARDGSWTSMRVALVRAPSIVQALGGGGDVRTDRVGS